jgi:solute carrier family 25 protein 16
MSAVTSSTSSPSVPSRKASDKVIDKKSWDYIVRTGIAGGVAGCVAKTVVAPLDRVKILFQASNPDFQKYAGTWTGAFRAVNSIFHESGTRGLLQGHSATLLRIFPYAAIKFMAYEQVHARLMPTRQDETPFRRFLAGSISGSLSVVFTYPLELVRVRLAFHTQTGSTGRTGLTRAISTIYHEGSSSVSSFSTSSTAPQLPQSRIFTHFPILKFYRGFTVTLIGMVPYAGTSFLMWGGLRSLIFPEGRPKQPTPMIDLGVGAVSGAVSQTVSYPFEVTRRRLQVGGLVRPGAWLGWGETVRDIWVKSGWRGFFVGLSIGYLKIVPMTAVSFACWEGGKRLLGVE